MYLTLTFRKTLVLFCENSSQYYIRLKIFVIVSSSCTWSSIHKYLFNHNSKWGCIALVRKILAYDTYRKNIGQYMKLKQPHFTEKLIFLAILYVNSVYKISEMYLSCALTFITKK